MADRQLPEADYAYIQQGSTLCPAIVLKRGLFRSRVLRFKVFEGTSVKTVRNRDLMPIGLTNAVIAFRNDPTAVLHMTGEDIALDTIQRPEEGGQHGR